MLNSVRFFSAHHSVTYVIPLVPKVAKVARKGAHDHAHDDEDEMLLLDRKPSTSRQLSQLPSSSSVNAVQKNTSGDDSVTEDEDEDMLLLDKVKSDQPARKNHPLPTPARSLSPSNDDDTMDIDPQRDPHRLIGRTHPLADFKSNLKQKDAVSKSVEDMCVIIEEVVLAPFAGRRTKEMLECLRELRRCCLTEDEIEVWNG